MGVPARNTAVPSASPKPVFALVTTKTGTTARRTGAAPSIRPFQTITDFSLTAAVSISSGLTPCGRSVSVQFPLPIHRSGTAVGAQRRQRGEPQHTGSYPRSGSGAGRRFVRLSLLPRIQIIPARRLKCPLIRLFSLGFPPGLVFMRFFSLPGDSRFFLSSPFCFRTCFAHLYVFVGLGIFTPMPLISTPSSAGMRIYRRPSMTRASIMWLYSGATAIFTSGVVI